MKSLLLLLLVCLTAGCTAVPKAPEDLVLQDKLFKYRQQCVTWTAGSKAKINGTWRDLNEVLDIYKQSGVEEASSLEAQAAAQEDQGQKFYIHSGLISLLIAAIGTGVAALASSHDGNHDYTTAMSGVLLFGGCFSIGTVTGLIGDGLHRSKAQKLSDQAAKIFNKHLSEKVGLSFVPRPEVNQTNWP